METKPGYLTTEFWTMVITNLINLANLVGIWNFVPNKYSAIIMAILGGAYAAARGLAKAGVKPDPTPVVVNAPAAAPPAA